MAFRAETWRHLAGVAGPGFVEMELAFEVALQGVGIGRQVSKGWLPTFHDRAVG